MPSVTTRFLYCEGALPQPAGTSPFQIKGEFYRQMAPAVLHHDTQCNGEVTRILEREALTSFWNQSFLSSAMYDALPLPRLMMAIAEARQRDVRELTVKMGKAAVEGQMNGVYANLLRPIAPHNFCGRFEQAIKYFYNFGPITATPVEGGARVVREGVPLCIAEWWSLVTISFAEVPLVAQGASDVTVDWRVAPSSRDRGVQCGTIIWDVRWKAPVTAS
jgi:hypothetical protein